MPALYRATDVAEEVEGWTRRDRWRGKMIAEIVGPSGRVHYRRPVDDPLVIEALRTPGYTVRLAESETQERAWDGSGALRHKDFARAAELIPGREEKEE